MPTATKNFESENVIRKLVYDAAHGAKSDQQEKAMQGLLDRLKEKRIPPEMLPGIFVEVHNLGMRVMKDRKLRIITVDAEDNSYAHIIVPVDAQAALYAVQEGRIIWGISNKNGVLVAHRAVEQYDTACYVIGCMQDILKSRDNDGVSVGSIAEHTKKFVSELLLRDGKEALRNSSDKSRNHR